MEGEIEIIKGLDSKGQKKKKKRKILPLCPRDMMHLGLDQGLQALRPMNCWPVATGRGFCF